MGQFRAKSRSGIRKSNRSVMPKKKALVSVYEMLQRDLLQGLFKENDRSRILFLHYKTRLTWMTRRFLRHVMETSTIRRPSDQSIWRTVGCLAHCFGDGSKGTSCPFRRKFSNRGGIVHEPSRKPRMRARQLGISLRISRTILI